MDMMNLTHFYFLSADVMNECDINTTIVLRLSPSTSKNQASTYQPRVHKAGFLGVFVV